MPNPPATPLLNAPLFAAVESDVVGYTTIEMQADKWYQVGSPFIPLTDGAEQTLNNTFTTGFSTNDQVYVYDPEMGSYKGPYVWGTANGQTGWWNTTTSSLTTTVLTPGQAFFIHKQSLGVASVLPGVASSAD